MATLATLIRNRRAALELTLQDVSDAAGLSKSHLHALENDRHPNVSLIACTRLSIVLGLTVQQMAAALLESNVAAQQAEQGAGR